MNRLTAAAATVLAAATMATGLAACSSSDNKAAGQSTQPTGDPATATSPADPASAPTDDPAATPTDTPTDTPTENQPAASGGGKPCDDEKFVVDLVKSVREGQAPDDPEAASQRVGQWLKEIPAEITKPGEAMAYVIVAMRHPGSAAVGGLGTDDMLADIAQLDAWYAKNC
ncbi:hypothetical protein [Kribbella sp. NPDC055071]